MPQVNSDQWKKIAVAASVAVAVTLLCIWLGSQKNLQPRHYAQLAIDGVRGGVSMP